MHLRSFVFAAAVAIVAPPIAAQSASALNGKWNIEYERGRRIENDVVTPVMGTGVLTLDVKGDSVTASLQAGPRPDGTPTPLATITGKFSGGSAVLVQKQSVRVNLNGESQMRDVTVTWTLRADGDVLSGTLSRVMPDTPAPSEPTAVKGTRAK